MEKLPETGVLCKDTYDRLRDLLKRILQDLKMLGYQLGFNPLLEQNSEKMISFVTQIQEDFRLGMKKTIAKGRYESYFVTQFIQEFFDLLTSELVFTHASMHSLNDIEGRRRHSYDPHFQGSTYVGVSAHKHVQRYTDTCTTARWQPGVDPTIPSSTRLGPWITYPIVPMIQVLILQLLSQI